MGDFSVVLFRSDFVLFSEQNYMKIHKHQGLDHGVGHPLLHLYDVKAPNGQKSNEFNALGHYPSNTSLSIF
jgi:hypothetical protein